MEYFTFENIKDSVQNVSQMYNPLQTIWDLRYGHEDVLRSPLFPIVLSVSFYFLGIIPFTVVDLYGKDWKWIQKYKIQPEKEVTLPLVSKAVSLTVWNHILYILPVSIAQWIWTLPTPLPPEAPGMWEFTWQITLLLLIFDFQYFVWHSVHHKVRFLYRNFHGVHHQYNSPFSWVTQYLHPWELFTVGFFTTIDPWLFNCHPMTCWAWNLVNIVASIEAHHGFDFPMGMHNLIPFGLWGGSIKHDMHHMKPLTNFQPYLNHWDRIFGSHCPGTRAGGYKSPDLIEYERLHRERGESSKSSTDSQGRRKTD